MHSNTKKFKLVLFDVDGTILLGVGEHIKAFKEAFLKVYNLDCDIKDIYGPTDLQILFDVLKKYKIKNTKAKTKKFISYATSSFRNRDISKTKLLPGVVILIKALKKEKNIQIGLVTGSIEDIAYIKLKLFNIDKYFKKGGFGGELNNRSDIINHAIKKFEKDLGKLDKKNIFIIGDAVHDIQGAKQAGVKSIAVATGKFSYEQLNEMNPDYIFKDLSDTKKVIKVIKEAKK